MNIRPDGLSGIIMAENPNLRIIFGKDYYDLLVEREDYSPPEEEKLTRSNESYDKMLMHTVTFYGKPTLIMPDFAMMRTYSAEKREAHYAAVEFFLRG
ncbi:hypothetical protein H8D36_02985 [archaeon]|nr:hypothetical protein [archaeon]MBL7057280.1 hypothetical protein [Candidatus Woesearchaeota archaeon]